MYTIVWLDAMHYKVKDGGRTQSRAVYNVLAVNQYGRKELIGMYVSESEGANFWLSVLTDLKARGLKDILLASYNQPELSKNLYKERWLIECAFRSLKTSGFNIEATHIRDVDRFAKMLSLVMLAFIWAYLIGVYVHKISDE